MFNIVRRWSDDARTVPMADYATEAAIEGKADGVVALGLAGREDGTPPEQFVTYFARAREAGLRSAPHAGELAGPDSVWGALEALGADRIGHGVRTVEDADLLVHLAENEIALEVCPTSNVRLGVYPRYADHALPLLLSAGVPVTIGSDDPPLFATTLTEELLLLPSAFRLDVAAIDAILLAPVRHCLLPTARRAALEADFALALKEAHLGSGC